MITVEDVKSRLDRGEALNLLDSGKARVAQKVDGKSGPEAWTVNQWPRLGAILRNSRARPPMVVTSKSGAPSLLKSAKAAPR